MALAAELADQLNEAGLDATYWADILKTNLGVTIPQQIQHLDESHLKVLNNFKRQEWEDKALRKFLAIDTESPSNQKHENDKSEIVVKLTEKGLDGDYWADILETKLGVTRMEQINNVQPKHLKILRKAVRYDWEEKALRIFFGVDDCDYEAFLTNETKQHKERLEEAKTVLTDVAKLKEEGVRAANDRINGKLDRLRELMNVPKDQWVETYDDNNLSDMITKMNSDLQDLTKLSDSRTVYNAADILANASAGLALRGILVGKAFSDDYKKRIVLSTPAGVNLMSPVMLQIDDVAHFSSKAQFDQFQRSLDTMGYSVAAAVKTGGWGLEAEAGFNKNYEKETEKIFESHMQTNFESRVKYSVVPTAACELNPHDLKLSIQALKMLKFIDRLLVQSKITERVEKKCEEFLKSYGSHINAGTLHFGGVNKFVATYTSETMSESGKTKAMVQDALSAYVSASYSDFGFSVGGSISADHIKTYGSFTADYEKTEQAKLILHSTRNGGPQEVNSLPLWKMGLVTCNSTWALIDRGETLYRDFVGIWRLISNHEEEFRKPNELASALKTVWEKISGYRGLSDEEHTLIKGLDTLDRLVVKIVSWNSLPVIPDRYIEHLEEIVYTVELVKELTGTNEYWEDKLCTEINISSFLGTVVEQEGKFAASDVPKLRFMIRKLIIPEIKEFRDKHKILKWAKLNFETFETNLVQDHACVKSLPDLIRNVKERFLSKQQTNLAANKEKTTQVSDSIDAEEIADLSLRVRNLLNELQISGDSHQTFLLNVVLMSLHYNWSTMTFKTLLTMEKLHTFVNNCEILWKDFQTHKEKGKIRHEAFLIHVLVTYGQFGEENETSEHEFSKMTEELRQVISPELNKVLNRYATHSPFNWVELARVTSELAKGNMSVVDESEVDIFDLNQIFKCRGNGTTVQVPTKSFVPVIPTKDAFSEMLKTLGLEKYYPSKLSMLNVMIIENTNESHGLSSLPWKIIRKILMIDFKGRDQLFSSKTQEQSEENDLDEFLLTSQDPGGWKNTATHLNAMDVLVTIFTCCDNFLKQKLAQALFVCKLAIPFLYPLGKDNIFMMSLWALRKITVQWYTVQKEVTETPVTEKPFPLVTFVRLGRPPMSKSKLMNDILGDASHSTFFNYDCNTGTVPRKLTDGLVECSWFVTEGKDKEILPYTTMFVNLRGDASSMKKQMDILQRISSVVFIVVSVQDLARAPNTSVCQHILGAGVKIILLLISGSDYQSKQELLKERQACADAVGMDFLKGIRIISSTDSRGIQKNVSDIKNEVRRKLSETLAECQTGMMIEEYASLAEKEGIVIDEYDDACLKGKALANNVVNHMEGITIAECKQKLLPLQGAEWIEYCKLLKEQHRASGKGLKSSSAYQANQMKQKMDLLRTKQVEMCCKRLTPFIKEFMSVLQDYIDGQQVVLYFLEWVRMTLDEKSRANLPDLRRQYFTFCNKLQQATKEQDKENMQHLRLQKSNAEMQLANASLGLENLFREVGQIFEAVKESGKVRKETWVAVEYLAEVAAKLLVKGSPLELIDGDSSSVPISWVTAVLSKLENIIGEKRFFVLSVLGIQSSGKSTLLNTMFGLNFAVSAGRCTRGAYMQLVPVDEHADLPFDYIVVVDTQGLRAPELGETKYEHDNELATLVIGLGDVTMVNIKGENTAEMKDILQIAVHAFLRMNLASKLIRDHRTCIFLHQNVAATNAKDLMMQGSQKLQENLNDMTREAALSENIAHIHNFSQIINFDVQKHVWHFSDLWLGDPPMAPANPGYSKKVYEVRLNLFEEIAKQQKTFLTTSDLSIRLSDLWNGVLADDFVFSFRNSLEVKAYNNLQSTYYTLEWELQDELRSLLLDAEIKLKMCNTIDDLDKSFPVLNTKMSRTLTEKAKMIETSLMNYFEKNNLHEITIQWQSSKLKQLEFSVEQQEIEGKKTLLSIKEAHRMELLQTQKWSQYEAYIMNKAINLADELKGREVTDNELEKMFNTMWVTIANELTTQSSETDERMDLLMENILNQRLYAHRKILKDEIKRHPLDTSQNQTSLEGSITLNDVVKDDISLDINLLEGLKSITGNNNRQLQARHKTVTLTNTILQEISNYLKDMCGKDIKFQTSYATEVIKRITDKFDSFNLDEHKSENNNFTIRPKYVVKICVHVSRHCVKVFDVMQSDYKKKYGVQAKLEHCKKLAWSIYKNTLQNSTDEVIAGDLLCAELKGVIEKAVRKQVVTQCVKDVMTDFQMTKYSLIVSIMDDLLLKGNFKEYKLYIKNAKEFALRWITNYTNEKMFCRKDGHCNFRYAEITEGHIRKIIGCVVKSVQYATDESQGKRKSGISYWIENFCYRVAEKIAVPINTLTHVRTLKRVSDFSNLQRLILDQLHSVEDELVKTFAKETKDSVIWDGTEPPLLIMSRIWGCPEQCPFCKEPCADTTADHYIQSNRSHMCVQHRPGGIGGVRWDRDEKIDNVRVWKNQLSHDICNYSIQRKNIAFSCRDCNFKCRDSGKCFTTGTNCHHHMRVEYKTYLPSWDISPDSTNSASKYWMWFMMTYQNQLKDMHKAKLPNLPEPWYRITKDDALVDLRKYHN